MLELGKIQEFGGSLGQSRRATRTIVFQPDATAGIDTYLQEDFPTTIRGAQTFVSHTSTAGSRRFGLFRLDMSSLAGRQATSGYLELTTISTSINDRTFFVHAVLQENVDWTEAAATWNTKDGTLPYAGDIGANGGTDAGCSVTGQDFDSIPFYEYTIPANAPAGTKVQIPIPAALLQSWIDDPGSNAGVIQTILLGTNFQFDSSDSATAANRPRWAIRHRAAPTAPVVEEEAVAFAGAQGYGRFSCVGHENWQVLHVTNLNSGGAGSLRIAVNQTFPRVIVFDVGGTITIDSQITVNNPYCVIAGQTAPGGGICIKSSALNMDAALSPRTHDVIIAGIHSRPGIGGTSLAGPRTGDAVDCFGNKAVPAGIIYNIYYYCCSGSWSVDEIIEIYQAHDVTVDRCLMAEPLNIATHSYTAADANIGHAKCLLAANIGSANVSVLRCVFAHSMDRHPEIGLESGYADVVNNVIYNWGTDVAANGGRSWVSLYKMRYGSFGANVVGNYFKPGLDSANRTRLWFRYEDGIDLGDTLTIYMSGNTDTALGNITTIFQEDETNSTLTASGTALGDAAYGTPLTAAATYTELITNGRVGAWYGLDEDGARFDRTDDVDDRIKADVAAGTGHIINSDSVLIVWPTLAAGTAYTDTDGDGIPDAYETANPGATLRDFLWG